MISPALPHSRLPWPLRALALALALVLAATEAHATAQIEEELVVGGRVQRMQATPLEAWIEGLPTRPDLGLVCTACWRGYIGTWAIQDDHLELLGLRKPNLGPSDAKEADDVIPLSLFFEKRKAPIRATWFSGVLRIAKGQQLRYVHMGFGTLYERSVFLRVEKGRIVGRREVDNRREGFGLSRMDMQWVALTPKAPPDDGHWYDARMIGTAAFRKHVPTGTAFRTRGVILSGEGKEPGTLWIPDTPGTEALRLELRGAPHLKRPLPHGEITATWRIDGGVCVLTCSSARLLKSGETFHHPKYEVPDLEAKLRRLSADAKRRPQPTLLTEDDDLRWLVGWYLELHGRLASGEGAQLAGAEVRADASLVGKPATATGLLEKWVVTQRLLDTDKRAAQLFRARGPGVYYRLVDLSDGSLARPRAP